MTMGGRWWHCGYGGERGIGQMSTGAIGQNIRFKRMEMCEEELSNRVQLKPESNGKMSLIVDKAQEYSNNLKANQ
ncbi:hypothetical protein E2C01_057347 [Portunus trituberculatus]|uniref:Uncharacterized protein n=1 Tax=Portunus trituberculatus TaxID=210409 RepID=A0A5B7GWJ2_PORTR|nr:hypothetical protein [Portunus trituberculatus]